MTEDGRKRPSGWKILGLIAGTVVLLLVATAIGLKMAVDHSRAEWDAELKASIAAERARSGERPVLSGEAKPGNAWHEYDQALSECQKVSAGMKLGEILDPKHDDKPDGPLSKLPLFASPIAHLRAGAHRAEARKDFEWERAALASTPSFAASSHVAMLALLEARVRAKEGKPSEAVAEILDVMQFGRDYAGEGPLISHMIGMSILGWSLQEARDLSVGREMDPASRELLERGLQTLLGEFPTGEDAMLRECLFMDSALQEGASGNFATGFLMLGAARKQREWIRRGVAAGRVSWAELLKVDREVKAEMDKTWNPFAKMGAGALSQSSGKTSRHARVQASLLLTGVHFQRTGDVLGMDDPFGSKLLSSKTGDTLKIWSVGPDGVDNGGVGGWRIGDGPDVVLDVKR